MPFNLQKAIDESYGRYKAALKAKQQKEEEEKRRLESEIKNAFTEKLNIYLSADIQSAIGMKIEVINLLSNRPKATANFEYLDISFTIERNEKGDNWILTRSNEEDGCCVENKYLQDDILIQLGMLQELHDDLTDYD